MTKEHAVSGSSAGVLTWASRRSIRLLLVLVLCLVVLVTIQLMTQMIAPFRSLHNDQGQQLAVQGHTLIRVKGAWGDTKIQSSSDLNSHSENKYILVANTTLEDLGARRTRVDSVCKEIRTRKINVTQRGRVQGVFISHQHKMAYCFVPKTGCTFWKQVFSFLNNVTHLKTPVNSPFDIPRLLVHLLPNAYGQDWSGVKEDVLKDYLRFMFARDPYSRLWSAYLDKFYLPDFWRLFGRRILDRRSPKLSKWSRECGMNVTFAEFVDFALAFNEPHWTPVSSSCDPCQFNPEVIGKMETYTRDARLVLDRVGLGWILQGVDHDKHVRNELEMLITYNFDVIYSKSPELAKKKCISDEGLGARLWTTFQHNGYIPADSPYVPPSPFSKEAFKERVLEAFSRAGAYGKDRLKAQKKTALEEAFKALPSKTLKRIADKYLVDFEMFDYEPRYFV